MNRGRGRPRKGTRPLFDCRGRLSSKIPDTPEKRRKAEERADELLAGTEGVLTPARMRQVRELEFSVGIVEARYFRRKKKSF